MYNTDNKLFLLMQCVCIHMSRPRDKAIILSNEYEF